MASPVTEEEESPDWPLLISWLHSGALCLTYLTGIIIAEDIRKSGSSNNYSIAPFLTGIASGVMWLNYGLLTTQKSKIMSGKFQIFLFSYDAFCYFFYSTHKSLVLLKILEMLSLIFFLGMLTRCFDEAYEQQSIASVFADISSVIYLASPLAPAGEIVEMKSAAYMPLSMILLGLITSGLLFSYGYLLENTYIQLQGLAAGIFGALSLLLICIFPTSKKDHPS